ncbi:PQQ-dependent sugar dehydrogenase, partial [Segetibacter koreensis]|uniref:PQQ-dependent sugar dehydrogenase n=1 Tax=Segetibacter koreensis TaxID=398037 RepID=UPI00035E1A37
MFKLYSSSNLKKFPSLPILCYDYKSAKCIKALNLKFNYLSKESPLLRFLFLLRKSGLICILFLAVCGTQSLAQTPPGGFSSTTVSSNWTQAVGLTFSASGNQMFVWEKAGKVWVVENNKKSLLIDISEEVGNWNDFGLLGFALHPQFETNGYFYLLYVVDRHHLMHYGTSTYSSTTNEYLNATIGRLTRYTATKMTTGYSVDLNSRKVLIGSTRSTGIPVLYKSHGVGSVVFGTDGTLLISAGDGASYVSNDGGSATETYYSQALTDGIITSQENVGAFRAQLLESYNGKILRIDPETGDGIPSNPFYETNNPGSVRSKVWSLGLRNPFRMVLKPNSGSTNPMDGKPGSFYVGDVGYNTWEDVNAVTKPGQNFGWPLFEGLTPMGGYTNLKVYNKFAPNPLYGLNGCTQQYFYFQDLLKQATASGTATFANPCNTTQTIPKNINTFLHTRPIIDFKHGTSGPSRTGVFNGETAAVVNIGADGSPVSGPQFSGNATIAGCFYTHEDFPAEYTNTLFFADYGKQWVRNMTVDDSDKPVVVRNFIDTGSIVVSMAVHPSLGGLYYVNYPSEIKKISYTNKNPVAVASADKTYGPSSLNVQFTGSGSNDPDGRQLSYLWDFGDGISSSLANPSHTFVTDTLTDYTVTLTVTDSVGGTDQTSLIISVNNTPPDVTILSPANNTLYPMTGDTQYTLKAIVTDKEHTSSQLSYQWQTILHHNDHEHPEPVDTSRETTTTISPLGCGEETYYYRILLTVTDAGGLSSTKEVKLYPDCNSTNIPPANTAPVLAPIGSKNVFVGEALSFTATATDVDAGQTLTFSLINEPLGAVINATTGDFNWTPAQAGTFTFTIRVTDNGSPALYSEEQITVTVTTAVASGNTTQTLNPLADAFVRNGTYGAKNYGSDTSLIVKSANV